MKGSGNGPRRKRHPTSSSSGPDRSRQVLTVLSTAVLPTAVLPTARHSPEAQTSESPGRSTAVCTAGASWSGVRPSGQRWLPGA